MDTEIAGKGEPVSRVLRTQKDSPSGRSTSNTDSGRQQVRGRRAAPARDAAGDRRGSPGQQPPAALGLLEDSMASHLSSRWWTRRRQHPEIHDCIPRTQCMKIPSSQVSRFYDFLTFLKFLPGFCMKLVNCSV